MFQDQIARFEWRNVCWDLIQSSKFLDRYTVSVFWFFLAKEMIGRAESLFVNASVDEMIFCRCFVKMRNVWIRSSVESVVKTGFLVISSIELDPCCLVLFAIVMRALGFWAGFNWLGFGKSDLFL